jgi:predicted peptidase
MKNLQLMLVLVVLNVTSFTVMSAEWQFKYFHYHSLTLPYGIYQPESETKIPLIIHLHGTGESGTDNQAQLYSGQNIGPDYFTSPEIQAIQKAIVLAPQTPTEIRWANTTLEPYNFKTTPSTPSMTALLKLIDYLAATNPHIDRNRIYMTGLSRGGQGAWNAALQRPHLFAAVVPIAGSASPEDARLLIHLPIWTFHASDDSVTNVDYTRDMVDAIILAGGTTRLLRYTEIQGGGHPDSWKTAFADDKLYRWMLVHTRH